MIRYGTGSACALGNPGNPKHTARLRRADSRGRVGVRSRVLALDRAEATPDEVKKQYKRWEAFRPPSRVSVVRSSESPPGRGGGCMRRGRDPVPVP
jgi:hypothetical protein